MKGTAIAIIILGLRSIGHALAALAEGTVGQDWWERAGDAVRLAGFGLYLGLESVATEISLYQPELVHGLFQTEDYIRAVQRGTLLDLTEDDIEWTVQARLARQSTLFGRSTPPRIRAMLSEWALTRPVGRDGVVARQRARLLDLVGREGIEIGVLPAALGPHPGFRGEFTILDFDDPDDPAVVCVETEARSTFLERPEAVARQRRLFERLQQLSVPIKEFSP